MARFPKNREGGGGFREGEYSVQSDLTGRIGLRSDFRLQWDGLLVHKDEWSRKPPGDDPVYQPMTAVPTNPRPPTESFAPEPDFLFLTDSDGIFLSFSDGNLITPSH